MLNTNARLVRWSDVPKEQLNPLLERQFVSGSQAMVAQLHLKKGCIVPTHVHHNEQISIIISGALQFILDPEGAAEQVTVRAGEVLVIPSNLPHSALAIEDTFNLDVFSPPREDWLTGRDAYLR